MKKKTCSDIYIETQKLAEKFANFDGYEIEGLSGYSIFSSQHKNIRIRQCFEKACLAQEFFFNHEMADVVDEIE